MQKPVLQPADENRSRRSHVSISSSKRPSVNPAGGAHASKAKRGMFQRAVPQMPRALAFLCFVLNLILPGTGMNKNARLSIRIEERGGRKVSLILITDNRLRVQQSNSSEHS